MGKKLNNVIIGLNNLLRGRSRKAVAPSRIIVLFSHCIQNSECRQKIVNELSECKRCGRCRVKDILEICERYGVKCAAASGSEMALEKVSSASVDAVVAVACERELAGGIRALFPKKVIAIPNTRPHGPCKDCGVDIRMIDDCLKRVLRVEP